MIEEKNNMRSKLPVYSTLLSIVFHLILFAASYLVIRFFPENRNMSSSTINIVTAGFDLRDELAPEKEVVKKIQEDEEIKEKSEEEEKNTSSYLNFNPENADTSLVKQIYKESTLNVSLRYPIGWTFIDQNVKNKLDGVTFWMATGNFSPPPYVHLEVVDKYLFNPSKFKFNFVQNDFSLFYNDPEELEGQVSQSIYIRTEEDEDFQIKLIIKGEQEFKKFQPVFFSMVKTFSFGKGIF